MSTNPDSDPYPEPANPSTTGPAPGPEGASRPDAMLEQELARSRSTTEPEGQQTPDPEEEKPDPSKRPARGVDWVRPTDLISRAGSRVARTGIDFQAHLNRSTRSGIVTAAKHLSDRAKQLPPLSAFGRGRPAHDGATRSSVGMR